MSPPRFPNPLSLFQKPKPRWSDPEESIDKFCGMKGKYKYWSAKGLVDETFQKMRPSIMELLKNECGPVASLSCVQFDIFLIGEAPETSRPHIMFSCARSEARKTAVAAMKESDIYNQCPPGFSLGHWEYPPHIENLELKASSGYQENFNVKPDELSESITSLCEGGPWYRRTPSFRR